jgi:hypothetical protein
MDCLTLCCRHLMSVNYVSIQQCEVINIPISEPSSSTCYFGNPNCNICSLYIHGKVIASSQTDGDYYSDTPGNRSNVV